MLNKIGILHTCFEVNFGGVDVEFSTNIKIAGWTTLTGYHVVKRIT